MRIAYISHTRFPTEKAHGHQMAQVCEALTSLGYEVTLLAPDVRTGVRQHFAKYYHIRKIFSVEHLAVFDALASPYIPGVLAFGVTQRSYRSALSHVVCKERFDLLYCRSPQVLPILLASGVPVVLELHTLPKRRIRHFVSLCHRCAKVVCLTSPMQQELLALGVPLHKTLVEGDAVDVSRFSRLPAKSRAREYFNLPEGKKVMGYVGSLVTMDTVQKGVDVFIKALAVLQKHDSTICGLIVGGPKHWQERYWQLALSLGLTRSDVHFHDSIPRKLVPDALAACDVCVYPAPDLSKKPHPFFVRDTSPLKLFEYLAAGKPVVCADIPPVRDVVDTSVVHFFHPGSVTSLAGALRETLEQPQQARNRAKRGKELMKDYTWEKRMERILQSL